MCVFDNHWIVGMTVGMKSAGCAITSAMRTHATFMYCIPNIALSIPFKEASMQQDHDGMYFRMLSM